MKKLTYYTLLICLLVNAHLAQARLNFGLTGECEGLFKPEYEQRFGLGETSAFDRERLKNIRLYFSVDKKVAKEEECFTNSTNLNLWDLRNVSDYPQDHVALILQRLFPSPDGNNLTPNQGSDQDPVRDFTPKVVGMILNLIRDFNDQELQDEEGFIASLAWKIDEELNPGAFTKIRKRKAAMVKAGNEDRNKQLLKNLASLIDARKETKKHMPIYDFTQSFVHALKDQEAHSDLYGPDFVEKALFAFGLRKVAQTDNQKQAMLSLYEAMPDVVVPNFKEKLHEPFTNEGYQKVCEKIEAYNESQNYGNSEANKPLTLTEREKLIVAYGREEYAQIFPELQYYSTALYNKVDFPNCGEISLLNVLNLLLFDFEKKTLRVDVLKEMDFVYPPLVDYYETYPTIKSQQTEKANQAWTDVVSGHDFEVDLDINYANKSCCISGGAPPMVGIVRALFPDKRMCEISNDKESTANERTKATLDHLFELFSTNGEKWQWKVEGASNNKEQRIKNKYVTINAYKSGENVPRFNGVALRRAQPILTWAISRRHYNTLYYLNDYHNRVMEAYVKAFVEDFVTKSDNHLKALDIWLIPYKLKLFVIGKLEMSAGVSNQVLIQLVSSLIYASQEQKGLGVMFGCTRGENSLELMAANLLEVMALKDPIVAATLFPSFLKEDGTLDESVIKLHPRITSKFKVVMEQCEDPDFCYKCIKEVALDECTMLYLLNNIPRNTLSESKVLKIIDTYAKDVLFESVQVWKVLFDRFGDIFVGQDGTKNYWPLIWHQKNQKCVPLIFSWVKKAARDVLKFFKDKKIISKQDLLSRIFVPNGYTKQILSPFESISEPARIFSVLHTFGFAKADVRSSVGGLFCSTDFSVNDEIYVKIANTLQMTREDFWPLFPKFCGLGLTSRFDLLNHCLDVSNDKRGWTIYAPLVCQTYNYGTWNWEFTLPSGDQTDQEVQMEVGYYDWERAFLMPPIYINTTGIYVNPAMRLSEQQTDTSFCHTNL